MEKKDMTLVDSLNELQERIYETEKLKNKIFHYFIDVTTAEDAKAEAIINNHPTDIINDLSRQILLINNDIVNITDKIGM